MKGKETLTASFVTYNENIGPLCKTIIYVLGALHNYILL